MELKEAYLKAFKEEFKPLVDAGVINMQEISEQLAKDMITAFLKTAKKGATYSADMWDNMVVPPAAELLGSMLYSYADKIDGKIGN